MQEFGGPEVLATAEVPDPVAGAGEAVVAVAAAHVLWVETRIRSGVGREYWGVTPPYVPGSGVAGRVESVGQDVDPALLGARVVAHTGRSRDGYAERVVVGADGLVPIPDAVSFAQAAALVHDGVTGGALVDESAGRRGRPRARGRRQRWPGDRPDPARPGAWGAGRGAGPRRAEARPGPGARRRCGVDAEAPDWTDAGADGAWAATAPTWSSTTSVATSARQRSASSPPAAGSPRTAPRAAGSRRSPRMRRPPAASPLRGIRDAQLPPDERRRLAEQAIGRGRRRRAPPGDRPDVPARAGRPRPRRGREPLRVREHAAAWSDGQLGAGPVHASAGR